MEDHLTSESVPISEVIHLLNQSASLGSDVAEKDAISADLNVKFENLDKVLDRTVRENEISFKESISNFAEIAADVTDAQDKVEELRTALISAKTNISPRREYFLQLWGSSVELHETIRLLDLMDDVCKVSDQAYIMCSEKQYFLAALLLSQTLGYIDNDLQDVGALSEIRQAIQTQQTALYDVLVDQLHTQLYMKWLNTDTHNKPTEGTDTKPKDTAMENGTQRVFSASSKTISSRLIQKFVASSIYTPRMKRCLQDVVEINAQNSKKYTGTLVEALRVLGRLDDCTETIKQRLQRELTGVTVSVVQEVNRKTKPKLGSSLDAYRKKSTKKALAWKPEAKEDLISQDSQTQSQKYLVKILELLFERLQDIFETHVWTLDLVKAKNANAGLGEFEPTEVGTVKVAPGPSITVGGKTSLVVSDRDVWLAIQNEVQEFIQEYLGNPQSGNARKIGRARGQSISELDKFDLKELFSASGAKNRTLFRFASSQFAVNSDPNKRENLIGPHTTAATVGGNGVGGGVSRAVVCDPSPLNFACFYKPVIAFCKEMEARCHSPSVDAPPLQVFMSNFGKVQFLDFIRNESLDRLKVAVEDPDAFAVVGGLNSDSNGHKKSLLVKSVVVVECIQDDLQAIVRQLPEFKSDIMGIMCDLLEHYQSACEEVYTAIMTGNYGVYVTNREQSKHRTVSDDWSRNEEIEQIIKQYPAWHKMKEQFTSSNLPKVGEGFDIDGATNKNLHLKQFKAENELLSAIAFRRTNIITHVGSFTTLACMHQSLEWLANKIGVDSQQSKHRRMSVIPTRAVPRKSIKALQGDGQAEDFKLLQTYKGFQDISDRCMLALKMEVRCQVYYYLIIVLQKSVYFLDEEPAQPDANVMLLNDSLANIEDAIENYLPAHKVEFVFDQVAELMCFVLMTYVDQIKKVNSRGVSKMYRNIFGLKQNLTNITNKYSDEFVKTIRYYELLNLSPKEIVDQETRDKTPEFTLEEFMRLFYVIHQSSPATEASTINEQIGRLKRNFDMNERDRASKARRRRSTLVKHPVRRPSMAAAMFSGLAPPTNHN